MGNGFVDLGNNKLTKCPSTKELDWLGTKLAIFIKGKLGTSREH